MLNAELRQKRQAWRAENTRAARGEDGRPSARLQVESLRLRLRRRGFVARAIAAIGHKLIELGAILGKAQPLQELPEFALLILEPAQGLGAVLIERAVAARGRSAPPIATFHLGPHAIHLGLHALHLRLPVCLPIATVPIRASHSAAP